MQDEESYIERLKKDEVEFLQLQFTDLTGMVKSLTIPKNRFEDVIYNGVMFDGSSVIGYKHIENSDMKAIPELSSYTILTNENYAGKTVRFMCKIFNPDGTRFDGDPRYILEKQVERLKKENKTYYLGPELEYFIFKQNEFEDPTIEPSDYGGSILFSIPYNPIPSIIANCKYWFPAASGNLNSILLPLGGAAGILTSALLLLFAHAI